MMPESPQSPPEEEDDLEDASLREVVERRKEDPWNHFDCPEMELVVFRGKVYSYREWEAVEHVLRSPRFTRFYLRLKDLWRRLTFRRPLRFDGGSEEEPGYELHRESSQKERKAP